MMVFGRSRMLSQPLHDVGRDRSPEEEGQLVGDLPKGQARSDAYNGLGHEGPVGTAQQRQQLARGKGLSRTRDTPRGGPAARAVHLPAEAASAWSWLYPVPTLPRWDVPRAPRLRVRPQQGWQPGGSNDSRPGAHWAWWTGSGWWVVVYIFPGRKSPTLRLTIWPVYRLPKLCRALGLYLISVEARDPNVWHGKAEHT